jgi:hypothetical protein
MDLKSKESIAVKYPSNGLKPLDGFVKFIGAFWRIKLLDGLHPKQQKNRQNRRFILDFRLAPIIGLVDCAIR